MTDNVVVIFPGGNCSRDYKPFESRLHHDERISNIHKTLKSNLLLLCQKEFIDVFDSQLLMLRLNLLLASDLMTSIKNNNIYVASISGGCIAAACFSNCLDIHDTYRMYAKLLHDTLIMTEEYICDNGYLNVVRVKNITYYDLLSVTMNQSYFLGILKTENNNSFLCTVKESGMEVISEQITRLGGEIVLSAKRDSIVHTTLMQSYRQKIKALVNYLINKDPCYSYIGQSNGEVGITREDVINDILNMLDKEIRFDKITSTIKNINPKKVFNIGLDKDLSKHLVKHNLNIEEVSLG